MSIAVIESYILCPFERLKTYLMTTQGSSQAGFKSYLQMSSSNNSLISDLYRGVGSLVLRQMVAWIYFLQADLFFKQKIRKY